MSFWHSNRRKVGGPSANVMDGDHVKIASAQPEQLTIVRPGEYFGPAAIEADYRRLALQSSFWIPPFSDFVQYWARTEEPKLLALAHVNGRLTGFASFSAFALPWTIFLGGNRTIRIPLVQAGLFGGSVLGTFNDRFASEIITRLFRDLRFDMLALANLPLKNGLSEGFLRSHVAGPRSVATRRTARRLIILPGCYGEFLESLRASTAKAVRRDQRMFGRLAPMYDVITTEEQIPQFVIEAAAVSSITQKTERGAGGVADTPVMRERLRNLAQQGRLRAYLARVDGKAVACAWGELSHGVFYFRDTAFDPAFKRYSPGRAILLHAVADLIDAGARVFDFGVIDFEYKARLSNHSVESANVYIARTSSPRGWLAVTLQMAADWVKALAHRRLSRRRSS